MVSPLEPLEPLGKPARLRREERTATSRTRILDAAVECLYECGYSAATTLRIQAVAGVSRGRLLHHFPSRDQLLVAASHHLAVARLRQTADRIRLVPDGVPTGERLDRAIELMWETFSEPYFWAAVELWTAARTDDELRAALLPGERELGSAIRAGVAEFYGPELVGHPDYEDIRDLLLSSMRGAGLSYALTRRDPATDPHLAVWKRIARTLLV